MRSILSSVAVAAAIGIPSDMDRPSRTAEPTLPTVDAQVTHPYADPDDIPRQHSSAEQRDSVSITVYNQNFGLVREVRTLDLSSGRLLLEFGDVASEIQPETVHIRPLGGSPLRVLEQNYQYDLLNPQKLLEKYVGRTVTVYRMNGNGEEEAITAEVLSVNGGPILRIGDEITFNYPGRFGFPEMPDNLIAQPTLLWQLDAPGGEQQVEVTYLTNSLDWKSDYVMVLDEDDDAASLTGWVTLTNQSGASYGGAKLQLVAGDVQRVSGGGRPEGARQAMMSEAMAFDQGGGFSEQSFFEYHLYTLGRPADVVQNEQKQVTLLESDQFGVDKELVFHGATHYYRGQYGQVTADQKVGVFLDFENSEDNGLGMPLPKGTVRVYKRDGSGAQQFIGEDLIDHTPRDETLRIRMGEAFDVVGDRRQTDYDVVSSCVSESAWEVNLRNHKDEDVSVTLVEPVGGDWEIISASHSYEEQDAWTFTFEPQVPAGGETTVTYRARVRWC